MSKSKTIRKSSKPLIVTGFTLGTWDATFEAIADARNKHRPAARKMASVLVESFTFNIHSVRGGKPSAKPLVKLELPRTKAAVERASSEWAKANPGKPFVMVYDGWFNGTNCLPRYNNPVQKGDRMERLVSYQLQVYSHTGTQGDVAPSAAEQAATAVMDALAAQK